MTQQVQNKEHKYFEKALRTMYEVARNSECHEYNGIMSPKDFIEYFAYLHNIELKK